MAAMCKHFQIGESEIAGRFFIDSGRDTKLLIAEKIRDRVIVNAALVEALTREIAAREIGCWIVDPLLSSHSVPENDNGAIEQVVSAYADLSITPGSYRPQATVSAQSTTRAVRAR